MCAVNIEDRVLAAAFAEAFRSETVACRQMVTRRLDQSYASICCQNSALTALLNVCLDVSLDFCFAESSV